MTLIQLIFTNSVPTLQEAVFATRIISLQLIVLVLNLSLFMNVYKCCLFMAHMNTLLVRNFRIFSVKVCGT